MKKNTGKTIAITLAATLLILTGCESTPIDPATTIEVVEETANSVSDNDTGTIDSVSDNDAAIEETDISSNNISDSDITSDKDDKVSETSQVTTTESDKTNFVEEDTENIYTGTFIECTKTLYVIKATVGKSLPKADSTTLANLSVGTVLNIKGKDKDTGWYMTSEGYWVTSSDSYVSSTKPQTTTATDTTKKEDTTSASSGTTIGKESTTSTTPTTSTPSSTETQTSETSTTTTPTVCQHKNTYSKKTSDGGYMVNGCWQNEATYHNYCSDCGADLGSYSELGDITHNITDTVVREQDWICGSQDGIMHWHHQCACGAINYDDPTVIDRSKEHNWKTYQEYDADDNLCEGRYCDFCGYKEPSHIIQYASTEE